MAQPIQQDKAKTSSSLEDMPTKIGAPISSTVTYDQGVIENADDAALRLQGHEQELERNNFNVWAALGLAFRYG